jgi:hypothetical protein
LSVDDDFPKTPAERADDAVRAAAQAHKLTEELLIEALRLHGTHTVFLVRDTDIRDFLVRDTDIRDGYDDCWYTGDFDDDARMNNGGEGGWTYTDNRQDARMFYTREDADAFVERVGGPKEAIVHAFTLSDIYSDFATCKLTPAEYVAELRRDPNSEIVRTADIRKL